MYTPHQDVRDFCVFVGCYEPVFSELLKLNPKIQHFEKLDVPTEAEGQGSFTSSQSADPMQYFAVPNPTPPAQRVWFGSGSNDNFVLPAKYGAQKHHFNIFVNDQPSWMLHILHTTTVNDEKLRRCQAALHPEDANELSINSLILVVFTPRDASESDWPQAHAESATPSRSSGSQTQRSSSTSASTINLGNKLHLQPKKTVFHVLSDKLQTETSRATISTVVYRSTGRRAIGKFYDSHTQEAAKKQFDILSDILKVDHFSKIDV